MKKYKFFYGNGECDIIRSHTFENALKVANRVAKNLNTFVDRYEEII